jgi:DNA polymerase-3 subunit delta
MVPDARESTIFALVAAMGRRDRRGALEVLDTLVREGEYLPLALSFLAGQFRMAITAKEARLAGAAQIQQYFSRQGVPMWKARDEQVAQTAQAFTLPQMRSAVQGLFRADRGLRDTRPDDRIIMEQLILALTA